MSREQREREEKEALERQLAADRAAKEKYSSGNVLSHAVDLPDLPDTKDIRELALSVEDDIFKTYYILMMSRDTPPAVKKSCADALADRAKGKPLQEVAQTVNVETKDVSLERVARMMLFAQRDAKERNLLSDDGIIDIDMEEEDG